jgi:hypothetical protein
VWKEETKADSPLGKIMMGGVKGGTKEVWKTFEPAALRRKASFLVIPPFHNVREC